MCTLHRNWTDLHLNRQMRSTCTHEEEYEFCSAIDDLSHIVITKVGAWSALLRTTQAIMPKMQACLLR